MRILTWVSFYWPDIGGVETISRQLAHALKSRGHTICVVAGHGTHNQPDVSDDDGIPVHRFHFREAIEKRDPMLMLDVQKKVARLKTEFAADLIHINCLDASIFFFVRSLNVQPAPSVLTLHWTPANDQWDADTIAGKVMRSASWVIAIAQYQLPMINALLPEMRDRHSLLQNGLQIPSLTPQPLTHRSPQRILCIGRIVAEKGFDLAVDAFAQIAEKFPDARLVIAGDGPEQATLVDRVKQRGISDRTNFSGWIAHERVPAAIHSSYMVVMPSRFEPFGLVAIEAGQMQRPVIASSVGGLIDIVVDGKNGILVADEDVAGLASAMARLLHNPDEATAMGLAGWERGRTLFTAENNTNMHETLFTRITTEQQHVTG